MLPMAKTRKDAKGGDADRQGVAVFFRIREDLSEALDKACKRSKRTRPAEIELAIEDHLEKLGLWQRPELD